MQNYTPGKPATVSFALSDEAGNALTPTGLRSRILDENETVLQDWSSLALPAPMATEVSVTVLGALNILTPPAVRGARVIELEVTTADGTTVLSQTIMLQNSSVLAFGVNTFLPYPAAEVLSADFVPLQLAGWHASQRPEREQALIEAYARTIRLPFKMRFNEDQSMMVADGEYLELYGQPTIELMTPGQIAQLWPQFLRALKRAQLLEADEILNGDPIRAARNSGLISNTTGESSQFFRTAKPLDIPVSPRAIEQLQGYINYGARIGRR